MPALPWVQRQEIDPDREYVVMASRLPLKAYRAIPGFLRGTMRIRRQLADTPGVVGYALNASLLRKTFWTMSGWMDESSLHAFAASDPHQRITQQLRSRMGNTRFEFFRIPGAQLPLTWDDVKARVGADIRS